MRQPQDTTIDHATRLHAIERRMDLLPHIHDFVERRLELLAIEDALIALRDDFDRRRQRERQP